MSVMAKDLSDADCPGKPGYSLRRLLLRLVQVLAGMPFAISILGLLAGVSVIGTLIAQNRTSDYYRATLGSDWYRLFKTLGFDDLYHAWWFVGLLGFVLVSILIALWRHGPYVWARIRPLKAIPDVPDAVHGCLQLSTPAPMRTLQGVLAGQGFRESHTSADGAGGVKVFARKGQWGKYGFFLVHAGVALIIVGALVTSQWGFRGVMNIPQGESSDTVYVPRGDDYETRQLPFQVRNQGFFISHYKAGMPSAYQTEIRVYQNDKQVASKTISVNDPLRLDDIAIYQASFGDAGSTVNFVTADLTKKGFPSQAVDTEVGKILEDGTGLLLSVMSLREHNVLNLSEDPKQQTLRDIGPSVDIRVQSPASGTLVYRVYQRYPNIISYKRLNDEGMTTFDLRMSPGDTGMMKLLSHYLHTLYADKQDVNPDSRRAAFAAALEKQGLPLSQAQTLGPPIALAEAVLQTHDLPLLFALNSYTQKHYTGLQVASDPGSWVVWVGSAALMIGLLLLYTGEYRVWVRTAASGRGQEMVVTYSKRLTVSVRRMLERLQAGLAKAGIDAREVRS